MYYGMPYLKRLEERCLDIKIRDLQKKDYKKAIQFAIDGMHFNWYMDSSFLLHLYGRYFWYLEVSRATQVIAAYYGDELAGVLLADMKGEPLKYRSLGKTLYVKLFDTLQRLFAKGGIDVYDNTNRELYSQYCKTHKPDGEITFLAANPQVKGKGIGTLLLNELKSKEKGKQVYLYTDNACTYQFYEHRGFIRSGEKEILLKLGKKTVPLKCFLYSKLL